MKGWDKKMGKKINPEKLNLSFLKKNAPIEDGNDEVKSAYKVLIADDNEEVHKVTKLVLRDFEFNGKKVHFLDSYTGEETKKILSEHEDTAIIFLDVVMEKKHSGLDVVKYIRNELNNKHIRIILRTGQPGEAPEEEVIKNYDINDYRLKNELTVKRINTTIYSALRNYDYIMEIESHREGLRQVIESSSHLFNNNSFNDFLNSVLNEISNFYKQTPNFMFVSSPSEEINGFLSVEEHEKNKIVAATGSFKKYLNKNLDEIPELKYIYSSINGTHSEPFEITNVDGGFIIKNSKKELFHNYVFVESKYENYNYELISLFLRNYSMALDNYINNNLVSSTQEELIFTFGKVIENHFGEKSDHVKRVSEMMYRFALCNNFSYAESKLIKVASTMHDIGKIGIPDDLLKKISTLSPKEIDLIKKHTNIGYEILTHSNVDILKTAAEIALNHHEKYDGSGYPKGKSEMDIPINARMLAIIDVFDAMTHDRGYKNATSYEQAIDYIKSEKDKHFDGKLVDVFLDNIDFIING